MDKQRIERALNGIAATIKEGPDTGSGVQLRRFLWSLYNQQHLINLWRMTALQAKAPVLCACFPSRVESLQYPNASSC